MRKKDVIEFFNHCAPWWDADMVRNEAVISKILDGSGIKPGVHVLDVACGTGVLFPDYLARGVASVTGIDISPEMVKIAREKFPDIEVRCGDVETEDFGRRFDAVVVYNAFPHFPDPAHLIQVLAGLLVPGGTLSVAHGMSRAALRDHHAGRAAQVSIDLLEADALAELFAPYFDVTVVLSDDKMYQVAGVRNNVPAPARTRTPMDQLLALMSYMVGHNDSHAEELLELATQLKDAGRSDVYADILDAVQTFRQANAQLRGVLGSLKQGDLPTT